MINYELRNSAAEVAQLDRALTASFDASDSPHEDPAYKEALARYQHRLDEVMGPQWEIPFEIIRRVPGSVDAGISYLESAPRCFRSGYLAEAMMHALKRVSLSDHERSRLKIVILRESIERHARTRYAAALAGALLDDDLEVALEQFSNTGGVVAARAKLILQRARHWVLSNRAASATKPASTDEAGY